MSFQGCQHVCAFTLWALWFLDLTEFFKATNIADQSYVIFVRCTLESLIYTYYFSILVALWLYLVAKFIFVCYWVCVFSETKEAFLRLLEVKGVCEPPDVDAEIKSSNRTVNH